jgi:hypothetical protein
VNSADPTFQAVSDDPTRRIMNEIAKELLPLAPEDIKDFRARVDERAQALIDEPPKNLASRVVAFRLTPGLASPKVTLSPGLVTALVFTAPNGQPWPVVSNVLGSGALFSAEIHKEANHQILVSPLARHGHSNLLVGLRGLDSPLMIRLEIASGPNLNRTVDGLVNFQIKNGLRPTADEPGVVLTPGLKLAYDLLAGVNLPEGSYLDLDPALPESLVYQGPDGGPVYVRTHFKVVFPTWTEKAASPGGLAVYEIPPIHEIIVEVEGRQFRVNIPRVRQAR